VSIDWSKHSDKGLFYGKISGHANEAITVASHAQGLTNLPNTESLWSRPTNEEVRSRQ
jgi:hypothetical protein